MTWPRGLRALAHRDFRLYFAGHAISILGSWIQQVALAWLVYRLTGSAALLGIVTFAALIPQLAVSPLAGAWIDRRDKRRLLMLVQGLLGTQAALLALLTALGAIGPAVIVVMAVAMGLLNAVDTPLRQSLIGTFVGRREDLANALALNAILFNIGRFVGPPVAGLLLGVTSEAACFALNAVSFGALFAVLVFIKGQPTARASGSVAAVFREGVVYAWRTPPVRVTILTLMALNFTASAYAVLLPVFAGEVFGGDATTLGWLWGAVGCGALLGTVLLAWLRGLAALASTILAGVALSAASLLVFALTGHLTVALTALAVLGFGISIANVGANIMLQSVAPDQLRGRVVSFFSATRFGFDALGGLVAGFVAATLGAGPTLAVEALALGGFTLLLALGHGAIRRQVQQVG